MTLEPLCNTRAISDLATNAVQPAERLDSD